MAKGEKMFRSSDVEKRKFSSEPFPAGDYSTKILGDTAEVRKKEGDPKAFPYVNCAFEALGTGKDGQRNRRVYHNFFLKMSPGKDGSIMAQRADQLKGLADALGEDINLPLVEVHGEDCVSAQALVKWLQAHDGSVVEAHIKIEKGGEKYPDKNAVAEFIESSEKKESEESDDDEELDEKDEDLDEDDEDEGEEDDDLEDDEDDDEDEKPAKKKALKKGKK